MSVIELRRCNGRNRRGEPCGRSPIPGGTVCTADGGRAPQTIAAARLRLLEGVEPAIARLLKFIEAPPEACAIQQRPDCGNDCAGVITAATGGAEAGPTAKIEISRDPAEALYELTDEQLAQRAEEIAARVRGQLPAAVDAEVIHAAGVQIPPGTEIQVHAKDDK